MNALIAFFLKVKKAHLMFYKKIFDLDNGENGDVAVQNFVQFVLVIVD